MNRRKASLWTAGGCALAVLAIVLLAAIAAHAAGLARDQEETAALQRARTRCTTTPGADTAQLTAQVQQLLAGAAQVSAPGLDRPTEQLPNARIIVATGIRLAIPARGQVIALATALQESSLINRTDGDRDSLGLFQQRPSQGWGTREQILDPVYAASKFYTALNGVDGWEQLPLTVAADRVQHSGFPSAYAQWEPLATALQQAIAPGLGTVPTSAQFPTVTGPGPCPTQPVTTTGTIPPGILPVGYQIPADAPAQVRAAIQWALGQLGTPYQWGGTCTNPHGDDPSGRCDCSSLVQRSYGVAGIALPRTTEDQVNAGTPVAIGDVRPGDLVFTEGPPNAPGHVAMAIGSGLLVQAPHTGDVVKVSEIAHQGVILAVRRIAVS